LDDFAEQHNLPRVSELVHTLGAATPDPVMHNLANAFVHSFIAPNGANELLLDQILSAVCAHVIGSYSPIQVSQPKVGGLTTWQLKRVCDYVEENLMNRVTLAELAGIVQLSPQHFCRAFHRSTGLPPHRFLSQRRIARAKDLLKEGSLPLMEIALATGFGGSSQFATAFKRSTGVPPREFRRSGGRAAAFSINSR
jgi:AraC-like DNA-binding protein